MNQKQKIHQHYLQQLQDKIDIFQDMITNLALDAKNDAKGSAGDKHETALSMMHIEQEKIAHKLKEVLEQKKILNNINPSQTTTTVTIGSLVQTNNLTVYITTALPKIVVNNQTVFGISPQSPLGQQLLGKQVGDSCYMNTVKYTIL